VRIRREAYDSIRAHGAEGFPYEICGLLVGRPGEQLITEARRVQNIEMQNPHVRYLIDDKEDMRIRKSLYKTDLDVLGYYHSHPNHPAQPSVFDTERSWESYMYVIVSVRDGEPADMNAFVAQKDRGPMLGEPLEIVE
jgi:proteasome lid subunit RPN8/RPN11